MTRTKKDQVLKQITPSETTESVFLDAAERLFAEHGYEGTTIRNIAEQAGVNLGVLHYYWGTKEALFKALCERRMRPVIEERLRRYDLCIATAAGGAPDLKQVLESSLSPVMIHEDQSEAERKLMAKLLARIFTDPSPQVQGVMAEMFDEPSFRFYRLVRQCCPHLDDEAFYWRMHGVTGTIQYATIGTERIKHLSHGRFTGSDRNYGVRETVQFLYAALMAPMTVTTKAGQGTSKSRPRK